MLGTTMQAYGMPPLSVSLGVFGENTMPRVSKFVRRHLWSRSFYSGRPSMIG